MPFWDKWFGDAEWDIEHVTPPWSNATSIHDHIVRHVREGELVLAPGGDELPDEAKVRSKSGFGWVPGALDGAFGHHGGGGESEAAATSVHKAFVALTRRATADRAAALYALLTSHNALDYLDTLLQRIVDQQDADAERLYRVARWLATSAPDREPVKVAVALLGIVSGAEDDRALLSTLGRHEEFTLYSVVALQNRTPHDERTLYELARRVNGWGRIHLVERLAETKDDEIRAWMLREGYQNSVMYEYTALICARTGGLVEALRLADPDDALLKGAGDLLHTLISGRGGPAEGIEVYADGAEATELLLRYLRPREDLSLDQFLQVLEIRRFLDASEDILADPAFGWPARRAGIIGHATAILGRPGWREQVRRELGNPDRGRFWTAAEAAKEVGIDPWEHYFERTRRGDDFWWHLMKTDDTDRLDRALRFAAEVVPLDELASGPSDALGLGPGYEHHHVLDWILGGLVRFPGKGWEFIRAGLRSPVTRNRNTALHALGAWPREAWPDAAVALIRRVVDEEPNSETRENARKLRDGVV